MLTALLITLREGLEAALILAVVISFLTRMDAAGMRRYVWLGAWAAAGLSAAAGLLLYLLSGGLSEEVGEIFEIAMTVTAVGVLTYMVMWMRGHGGEVRGHLERKTEKAARAASPLALAALAFAAVGREGLETVLFLFASVSSGGFLATTAGGATGLALAAVAGVGLYRGSSRLNIKVFFNVTGILLIIFAAGILSYALHELEEVRLPSLLVEPVWDTGAVLSDEGGAGAVLKTLFGYTATPSLMQIAGYWTYLGLMCWLYLRPYSARRLAPADETGA